MSGYACRQGYLYAGDPGTVRVRAMDDRAYLTVKGKATGISRDEFEYEIPLADAEIMLTLCEGLIIEKTRYLVPHQGHTWEVDVFDGANAGLIIAELELSDAAEAFELPAWVGDEVSLDRRYTNAYLSQHPYSTW
ncbi:MAG: CYTH domain-containing protein [Candidatus Hydrogenedentes bacterium]|nr:CYTH domain-containing protein [Candidatus Hydrogenedentota bacterium]